MDPDDTRTPEHIFWKQGFGRTLIWSTTSSKGHILATMSLSNEMAYQETYEIKVDAAS
jgi:hypothetical protein